MLGIGLRSFICAPQKGMHLRTRQRHLDQRTIKIDFHTLRYGAGQWGMSPLLSAVIGVVLYDALIPGLIFLVHLVSKSFD